MRTLERFPNLVTLFFARAREKDDAPMLWHKRGGQWRALSWRDTARQVATMAAALRAEGVAPGDRVMLVSENRPEFCIADLAVMAIGAVSVPAYTTNTPRDHRHILTDSGASAVIVSTEKLARALLPAVHRVGGVRLLVAMEPLPPLDLDGTALRDWGGLMAAHSDAADAAPEACAAAATATREDLACLIYTSGTGGAPRGVRQHHGAILSNVEGCAAIIAEDFGWEDEIFLSFLPLSHAYEHSAGQFFPIALGAQIYYAEGLDKLAGNIAEVRPTLMIVVPRLFEVLRARVTKAIAKQGRVPALMLDQALRLGTLKAGGKRLAPWDRALDALLERSFRPKVRARFGGRIKALVSGGAPLTPEVGLFFQALGLTLLQGYGQTEAGPVISVNRPAAGLAMDTVGPPLAGATVRIAADGEILVRGEMVMHGYWHNPEETARALEDGWLHTGDVGEIDAAGRIRITDRKKDLIVNDKGDNISPQRVEGLLALRDEIAQAMVSGDRRPYLVGLLVPDEEWLESWARAHGKVAHLDALKDDPAFVARLAEAVDRVNGELAVTERVRRFVIADAPFGLDNEMLTPSLKIRRHKIRAVYQSRLDALYRA